MKEKHIKDVLEKVKKGDMEVEEAYNQLRDLPFKDIGFASIDNHRALRTGFPEVVFCQGKTPDQIAQIMAELAKSGGNIMGTRASEEDYAAVRSLISDAEYYETARIVVIRDRQKDCREGVCEGESYAGDTHNPDAEVQSEDECGTQHDGTAGEFLGTVAVITAGTADIPVAEEAAVTAEILGNRVDRIYDVGVAGIHRLFDKLDRIRSADVVIVIAGMEGALASVVGGLVDAPVVAVPTSIGYGANLGGLSALLSMLNSCANGVGVVNIDNGFGAAYLASVINRKR